MSDPGAAGIEAALAIEDPLKRSLYVVALWTQLLSAKGVRPVVVGGTAVEFYTFGAYSTRDIDVVCAARDEAIRALESLGFAQTPSLRHWYHKPLGIIVEIPDEQLAGDIERAVRVQVENHLVWVIGIEDLILDRLRAYVHWQSEADGEWARRLMVIHAATIDWEYLRLTAARDLTVDALTALDPRPSLQA